MSNDSVPKNAQPEQEEALTAKPEQPAEKTASPVKQQAKVAEADVGTGEESRDSAHSAGQESAEGDEEEEVGDEEEETDEEHAPHQKEEKSVNGYTNGEHQQEAQQEAEAVAAEPTNGETKARKRIIDGPDNVEEESSQKKQRTEDGNVNCA